MNRIRKTGLTLLAVIMLFVMAASPVLAYLENPTSVTVSNTKVFRPFTDDMLVVFHYSIPYAADNYTSTPASKTITFNLVNSSGETIQSDSPYVYPTFGSNGYGEGDGSFYFAANATPTWGANYTVEIELNPIYFTGINGTNKAIGTADWISVATDEGNQDLLADWILLESDVLTADYSATGVELRSAELLTAHGEAYYLGAIPGLSTLCPQLFYYQTIRPEQMTIVDYDMTGQAVFTNRLVGTDLGDGFDDTAALFGVGTGIFWSLAIFVSMIVAGIIFHRKTWPVEIVMILGAVIAIGIALLIGDLVYSLMLVGAMLTGMYIIWQFLLKRS